YRGCGRQHDSALPRQAVWETILVKPGQGHSNPVLLRARMLQWLTQNVRALPASAGHQTDPLFAPRHRQRPPHTLTPQRTGVGPPSPDARGKGVYERRWET